MTGNDHMGGLPYVPKTTPRGLPPQWEGPFCFAAAMCHWLTEDPARLAEFTAHLNGGSPDLPDASPAQIRATAAHAHNLFTPYCDTPIERI